jgi:hypothetical protein
MQWVEFWKRFVGQAVGGEVDLMVLIGGAERNKNS